LKLFWFMVTGKLDREMKRLGKRPVLQLFWFFYVSFLQFYLWYLFNYYLFIYKINNFWCSVF
jgi:hypothetical protein